VGRLVSSDSVMTFGLHVLIVSQALAIRTPLARLSSVAARNLDAAPLIPGHAVLVAIPSSESATNTDCVANRR
jgi:hypothetical protein